MRKIAKYRYFSLILHIIVWSIVLFFPYFISSADTGYKIGPLPGLYFTLSGVIHMIIFYTHNFYFYPKLLNRTYWWLYILMAISIILLSRAVKFYILFRWFPNDILNAKTHVLFPSVTVFVVSILYSITVEKIRIEKLQKENEALQLGMELKFLRSQVSPHFLFNILTNLVFLQEKSQTSLKNRY
jgi:two-component system, LytTR family, sensor kinase